MSDSVQMPALGESVTEGTVTRWLKQVGEHVDVDEPLLEVSTDKVDTEIPSPVAGVIQEILVSEDETVAVGTALARIGDGSGGEAGGEGAEQASAQEAQPRTEPAADQVQAESTVPTPDVDAPPVRPSSTEVEEPAERPQPTAQPAGDGQRVQMPALGESVTEGTVTRWLKKVGDRVEVDEPLVEVSTDKVDTEIPSPLAGTLLSITAEEDDTVADLNAGLAPGEFPFQDRRRVSRDEGVIGRFEMRRIVPIDVSSHGCGQKSKGAGSDEERTAKKALARRLGLLVLCGRLLLRPGLMLGGTGRPLRLLCRFSRARLFRRFRRPLGLRRRLGRRSAQGDNVALWAGGAAGARRRDLVPIRFGRGRVPVHLLAAVLIPARHGRNSRELAP